MLLVLNGDIVMNYATHITSDMSDYASFTDVYCDYDEEQFPDRTDEEQRLIDELPY